MKNKFKVKDLPEIFKKTAASWYKSEPFRLSAIIAYYSILSLPAFTIIILNVVGSIWGQEIVQGELLDEITKALGPDTAESIRLMILEKGSSSTSRFTTVIGIATLIYGSTGVFFQLQSAFDKIWEAESQFKNGIIAIIVSRVKSFGFILILGFLLLVSLILTSLLSAFSKQLEPLLPENLFESIYIIDIITSLVIIYVLFAAMFKFLPNIKVPWKSVRIGAALTAILFLTGKHLLALYFREMQPGSTYGAAGSVILIMLWVSYTSLILFFGAQFTKVYSDFYIKK
ncbi:YihY/virulence factor BrkB family protein [Psychroserpens mesophilus]|uniref:YihY/virulence factor BrkB family protein n=1 Tax=Psychroserpens mesophilus TaxID=325473 RepID=UPI003D65FE67